MALIASMINQAKNRVSETGTLYLLWGYLILICCIVQFISYHFFDYLNGYYIWFSTWILLVYQIFFLARKKKNTRVRTYTDEINGFVWVVFFISMMLVIFIGIQMKKYEMINPVILVLYGMPTFLTGIILKFKPLVIGGICCWVISILAPFFPGEYQLLLTACAVLCGWIIPGHFLRIRFQKSK